ncbi:DUF58 domain-containing protein [Salinisphaera japonica]|uniref:DUF58 domain-containing protein n=1 Tax=Salinisphaera japonica TaxID=1304270 RepID=UPI000F4B60D9|nr:DUF58 domain-containing protein [Salinisphaera japonica]
MARRVVDRLVARGAASIARRAPRGALPLRVSPRRLYILPTRFGGVFALLMIGLLVGATNYGNNLAFALAFWLGAIALVSMHRAHRNLSGLSLADIHAEPAHAGDQLTWRLTWASKASRPRRRLAIALADARPVVCDIGASATVTAKQSAGRRGEQAMARIHIESRYPLGLFRCWAYLAPRHSALVYPSVAGTTTAHDTADAGRERTRPASVMPGEFFRGHRRYRDGDTWAQIDWKHSARRDHWLVRESEPPVTPPPAVFAYHSLGDRPHEARLSQLARWVIEAAALPGDYRLILPDIDIGPASGRAHRTACLDALARQP